MVRVINLEDRFDGLNNSGSVVFDVNTFAKEYFLEANAHWVNKLNSPKQLEEYMKMMSINITEMNAVGSMTKESLEKSNQTKWSVPKAEDPEALLSNRNLTWLTTLNDTNKIVLQPQEIKTFRIKYPGGAKKNENDPN